MTNAIAVPGPLVPRSSPYLWAAVGALGAATLAMGAALAHVYMRPDASHEAAVRMEHAPMPSAEAVLPDSQPKQPVAPVNKAGLATKNIAVSGQKSHASTAPGAKPQSAPAPVHVATTPSPALCVDCGTVESVTAFQREATPSGAGAVAGAVLGGLVGNQVGGGDGKTVATILGLIGGGGAGNAVEKRMKHEPAYRVTVRMEDGSVRTVEQSSAVAVGSRVTVEGNSIRPAAPGSAKLSI